MLETHPFPAFVPKNSKYLLLGSFTGMSLSDNSYNWYYNNKRNQFWPILRSVYGQRLKTITEMQNLFSKLNLAVTDIIYQCERVASNNLDTNLINIIYNTDTIVQILQNNPIQRTFFSSRFVENKFRKVFPQFLHLELITLPSPSPRYAQMTKNQKITVYSKLLPKLN